MDEQDNPTGVNVGSDKVATTQATDIASDDVKDISQSISQPLKTPNDKAEETLSQQEKLRRAKIAMEGFERTVKREAVEKEEQAGEEKQKINKLLDKVNHDKELLELTWVNLDDKRAALKKLLEPLLTREEKLETDENQLESQEDVTFSPRERRELEQKRWSTQTERRKLEEEKWIIQERVLKIEEQIEDNKKKYQGLLAEEDKLRSKLKDIDEQVLLQEEVLRQQRELQEESLRQETLKKASEEKRRQEMEAAKLAEAQKAEEEKRALEEKKRHEEELLARATKEQSEQQRRFAEMKKAEEERQKEETAKMQAAAAELKKKIEEASLAAKQASASIQEPVRPEQPTPKPTTPNQTIAEKIAVEKERHKNLKELEEIELIRQENKAAVMAEQERETNVATAQASSLIDRLREEEGLLKPLRTFKDDLEEAMKKQQRNNTDEN